MRLNLAAKCGDGFRVAGVEECDDKNTVKRDGCNDLCKIGLGYQCDDPVHDVFAADVCTGGLP